MNTWNLWKTVLEEEKKRYPNLLREDDGPAEYNLAKCPNSEKMVFISGGIAKGVKRTCEVCQQVHTLVQTNPPVLK